MSDSESSTVLKIVVIVVAVIGAIAAGWLESLSGLGKFHKTFEVIGGILLILSGLYLINVYFIIVPALAA